MAWVYSQKSGSLYHNGRCVGVGYSGKDDGDKILEPGEGINDPTAQDQRGIGPIPCGWYTIGEPFDSYDHGPYCLPLTPDVGNDMHGRSGFLFHGDSVKHPGTASRGCIILARYIREQIGQSADKRLQVVASIADMVSDIG